MTGAGKPVIRHTVTEPDGAVFEVSKWAACDGCKVEDHDACTMPISKGVCCCE